MGLVRDLCTCRLSGRAYYARRCPRCGRYRDRGMPGPFTRAEHDRYIAMKRRDAEERRRDGRALLAQIARACEVAAPERPVARRPNRPMDYFEQRAWERRAYGWEVARSTEIEQSLRLPVRLLRELEQLPAQRRYRRAARAMVAAYAERMRQAGWHVVV